MKFTSNHSGNLIPLHLLANGWLSALDTPQRTRRYKSVYLHATGRPGDSSRSQQTVSLGRSVHNVAPLPLSLPQSHSQFQNPCENYHLANSSSYRIRTDVLFSPARDFAIYFSDFGLVLHTAERKWISESLALFNPATAPAPITSQTKSLKTSWAIDQADPTSSENSHANEPVIFLLGIWYYEPRCESQL